jgi:hypothetical protein
MQPSRALLATALMPVVVLAWLYGTTAFVKRQVFNNWNTESNGLIMPRAQSVDMVLLGTSHGRNFSRFSNHQRTERLLHSEIVNLSRGGGAGIVPMLMDLKWFFDLGNRTQVVVYFIDPWVLYSSTWNENNFSQNPYFFKEEPFSFDYALRVLKSGGKRAVAKYVREKLRIEWLLYKPVSQPIDKTHVAFRDSALVKGRLAALYNQALSQENFRKYTAKLEELVQVSRSHDARLVFVVTPTLLAKEPGHDHMISMLKMLRTKYKTPFFDFSESIKEPHLYSDHDHLNTEGLELFISTHLKPALSLACGPNTFKNPN